MSLTTKWDGSVQTPANTSNERSLMLGTFLSSKKVNTYYPIPAAYSQLIPVSYIYKVPPKFSGRPDLIANELYKDASLWWVVLWANNIIDPFARPYAGDLINIVDIKSIKNLMR